MGSTKLLSRISYFTLSIVYFFTFLLVVFLPTVNVSALTAGNFVVYTGAPADQEAVNAAYNKELQVSTNTGDKNYYLQPAFGKINILVKDFLGLGKTEVLTYDRATSEIFGKDFASTIFIGVQDQVTAKELIFSKKYFCALPSNALSYSAPTGTDYVEINYSVGLRSLGDGNVVHDFFNAPQFSATGGTYLVKLTGTNGQTATTRELHHDRYAPWSLDDTIDGVDVRGGAPTACLPANLVGDGAIGNFNKLTAAQKEPFSEAVAGIVSSATGADTDKCKSSGFSLSWIICPVIELGIGMTDFVFKDIIRPLLEDIPITTDPADGSYKAWQQFRVLGNIVLVGAMIAVVYAQVKGG